MKHIIRFGSGTVILSLLLSGSAAGADRKPAPPEPDPSYWRQTQPSEDENNGTTATPKNKPAHEKGYWRTTFGPQAGLSAAVNAGIGQLRDRPREWGGGIGGFGQRAASGFGTHIIKNTIEFPLARMLHEDLRYHRSTDTRFGPRLRHALISTIWTPKTNSSNHTFSYARVSGAFGGGLLSRLWQPASAHTLASGFSSGGISLGAHAGANVLREFWPRGEKKRAPVPPHATPSELTPPE